MRAQKVEREQLQMMVYGIPSGLVEAVPFDPETGEILSPDTVAAPPMNAPARPMPSTPFGAWLLRQERRDDWIGVLGKAAKADRSFPKAGDPEAVRKRLSEVGAEADMFEALDAAEIEWLCY
ncbi:hypothetical protein [Sphingomonas sanxanigenens]|uniref:Uncharacterized protein n=1 Tax=Sphingomonas sanxanigenens DSM 19645 = NX02 TaxID=1123269 RepID=W0AGA7_9SPHN|nr:hypothetical protein [Sphingomonas sanxanigenens]AHE55562.1 hypothetical protein NX02_19510 [Sphingomonas sanxanigenens DSM 19645 = NX02]